MCKWLTFMGGLFKKKTPSVETTSTRSGSSCVLHSSQQFYEEYQKQLTGDNIRELSIIFRMIDISSQVASKSLFAFMNKRGFRDIFKRELQKFELKLKKPERTGRKALSSCLKNHCFAVLSIYLDMVEYLHDPFALNNFLEQIAISHSFLIKPKEAFQTHDFILKQFFKQEFGGYMSRSTRKALNKYLLLISTRLQALMEEYSWRNDFDGTSQAMESQRRLVKAKIERLSVFKEVYVNPRPSYTSQYSLIPSEAIYPGTSKGLRASLDKRSK